MPLPLLGGGSISIVVNYKFSFTYEEIFKAYEDCIRHKKNSPNAIKFMLNKNENIIQLCDEINDTTNVPTVAKMYESTLIYACIS